MRGAGVPGAPEEGAGGGLRHVCGARGPLWQPGRAVLCEYHAATYVCYVTGTAYLFQPDFKLSSWSGENRESL